MATSSGTCVRLRRRRRRSRSWQSGLGPGAAHLLLCALLVQLFVFQHTHAKLAEGVCRFDQHFISETTLKGNPNNDPLCQFQVLDDEFLDVIGSTPKLKDVGQARAANGPVYVRSENMIYYTTRKEPNQWSTRIEKMKFTTFQAGEEPNEPLVFADGSPIATGMALHPNGSLLAAFQGVAGTRPSFGQIALYNLTDPTASHRPFADNFCGTQFNSPHDLAVTSNGEVYFTDPTYGYSGGFKGKPELDEAIYRVRRDGFVEVVATGLQRPKGIALTKDGKKLYVSESAAWTGNVTANPKLSLSSFDVKLPHNIWSFDVRRGRLANKQFFTSTMNFGGFGVLAPMALKTDTSGRVYVATYQGVQVYSSSGSPIGVIKLLGVTSIGWGGKENDHLIILDEERIRVFKMATCCGVSSGWRLHVSSSSAFLAYLCLLVFSMICLDIFDVRSPKVSL